MVTESIDGETALFR